MTLTKQALKVIGTLLFLYGVFGYIFPRWGAVAFTNNENLYHIVSGLFAITLSNASPRWRTISLVMLALFYLAWGIWGFTLTNPLDATLIIKKINLSTQLDLVDNIVHISVGLVFAWTWLNRRQTRV